MKPRIKWITIVTQQKTKDYIVGSTKINGITVDEIKDSSVEWENGIDFIYQVYGCGHLLAEVINCPVNVDYFTE